jgi:hypothetical protein
MLLPLLMLVPALAAQGRGAPQPVFHDDLLDQFQGVWNLTGTVQGQPVHETVFAEWVLNHQFLMVHRKQVDGPNESFLYLGYDTVSDRYVIHRMDTSGGRASEFLGYGLRSGDKIVFIYEYPSRPYRMTLSLDSKEKTWQLITESKERQGWAPFANETLRQRSGPPIPGDFGRGRARSIPGPPPGTSKQQ